MVRHRESALPLCRNCNWFWSASLYSNFESLSKTHMVEGNGAVQPTWTLLSLRGKCASNACSRQEEHRALHLQRPQKSVAVEMWKLQARDEIEAAGRSGAKIDSWRAAQKSRVDAFSLPQHFAKFQGQRTMPSKEVDHIEVANSKSIEEFINEYLPPRSVAPTPSVCSFGDDLESHDLSFSG